MKITIDEKEYGLQWGMGAIEMYCEAMDCDIDGLDKVYIANRDQPKAIVNLILAAIRNYAELKEEENTLSYRRLQAWLDESEQETFVAIMDDFKASKYLGRTIASYLLGEEAPETGKKKQSRSAKS